MKHIWEEKDIIAGLFVIKNTVDESVKDLGYARTVTFKIGYTNTKEKPYGIVNILTDGWYLPIGTKIDIVKYLNDNEFRPVSKSFFIKMIQSSDQGFI